MVTLKYKPEPDYVSEVFNSQVLNVLFSKICFFHHYSFPRVSFGDLLLSKKQKKPLFC